MKICKSFLIENILKNSINIDKITQSFFSTSSQYHPYPYTNELFRKNFIRYQAQSMAAVQHDYIYSGNERLKNLDERLKEYKRVDDETSKINIGKIPQNKCLNEFKSKAKEQFKLNKVDQNLQRNSRSLNLKLPLSETDKDWRSLFHFKEIENIGYHYNIFKDLFGNGYFLPVIDSDLKYEFNNNSSSNFVNVRYGNKIEARVCTNKPLLKFDGLNSKRFYTLIFTNLDGNLNDNNNEVLLWFLENFSSKSDGNDLFSYLSPFPMKGTGWHRCVYVLYEHMNPIDFKEYFGVKDNQLNFNLYKRSFKTKDFFFNFQKDLTPVSFSFFQTKWDESVKSIFHNLLSMKEPIYEFDFEKKFIPIEEKYPIKEVFNWYLQEYHDVKETNEEIIKKYLKELSPFSNYPSKLEYPLLENNNRYSPKWYKYELDEYKKREHKWNNVPYKYFSRKTSESFNFDALPFAK